MKDNETPYDKNYEIYKFLTKQLRPPLVFLILCNIVLLVIVSILALFYTRIFADISLKYGAGLWNAGQNAYGYIYRSFGGDCALIYLALGTLVVPYIVGSGLCSVLVFPRLYNGFNRFLDDRKALIFTLASGAVFVFFILQTIDPSRFVRTLGGDEYVLMLHLFWWGVGPLPVAGLAFLIGVCVLFGRFIKMGAEPRP